MKTKAQNHLTPETIATYRAAATRPSVHEQLDNLNRCSWHHEILRAIGMPTQAHGAERAWLAAAIRLGATPARSAEEALLKAGYLRSCLEQWVVFTAKANDHVPHAALISGAVGAEEDRWGHPAAGSKPN